MDLKHPPQRKHEVMKCVVRADVRTDYGKTMKKRLQEACP